MTMLKKTLPPGPPITHSLKLLRQFRRDPLTVLRHLSSTYGDVCSFRIGPLRLALVNDPELIKDILSTHHKNFVKGRPLRMAKKLIGDGLLTSEGEFHHRQYRMIQPAFHRKRIEEYAKVMSSFAQQCAARWTDSQHMDIASEMNTLTTRIAGMTMFSTDVESESSSIIDALERTSSLFPRVITPYSEYLFLLPLPSTFRFYSARRVLYETIESFIRERRNSEKEFGDLLSLLMAARSDDEGSVAMSDMQVRDEALTLFLTAFDTTSLALSWTWYLLAQHPDVEKALHLELQTVLSGRAPTPDDISNLPYCRAVITESLRLYPPLYVIARETINDYSIGEYQLPAGTLVLTSQYLMHRDPRFYNEALEFRPERWLTGETNSNPKYSFFPFGGGPRSCIGESYAWMEAVVVLATLAQQWTLQIDETRSVQLRPLVNLRPQDGIHMIARRRA